jgi:hypothetical protein
MKLTFRHTLRDAKLAPGYRLKNGTDMLQFKPNTPLYKLMKDVLLYYCYQKTANSFLIYSFNSKKVICTFLLKLNVLLF